MNTTAKPLTALGMVADKCKVAGNAASNLRRACETHKEAAHLDMKSYREGEAAAYNDAYRTMKAELQRLRNLLQNGSLTQADFGDDLPY